MSLDSIPIWPSTTGKLLGISSPHFIVNQQVALQVVKSPGPAELLQTLPAYPSAWLESLFPRADLHTQQKYSSQLFSHHLGEKQLSPIGGIHWDDASKANEGRETYQTFLLGENDHMPFRLSKACDPNAKPLLGFSNAKNWLCTDHSNVRMSSWEHADEACPGILPSWVKTGPVFASSSTCAQNRVDVMPYVPNTCL